MSAVEAMGSSDEDVAALPPAERVALLAARDRLDAAIVDTVAELDGDERLLMEAGATSLTAWLRSRCRLSAGQRRAT